MTLNENSKPRLEQGVPILTEAGRAETPSDHPGAGLVARRTGCPIPRLFRK